MDLELFLPTGQSSVVSYPKLGRCLNLGWWKTQCSSPRRGTKILHFESAVVNSAKQCKTVMYESKIMVLPMGKKKLLGGFLEIYVRSKDLGNLKGYLLELKAAWKQNCISKSYRHVNENSVTQQAQFMNKHYCFKWGLGPSEEVPVASS